MSNVCRFIDMYDIVHIEFVYVGLALLAQFMWGSLHLPNLCGARFTCPIFVGLASLAQFINFV